jgi:diguanylate cyclase (GGDEF)-like protein/PAS domain S-box-containing protein
MRNHLSPPRILIADDDLAARLLLREALERDGFQVLEAADGAEALDRFVAERPEAVVLDVMMPGTDGFTACRGIRALPDTAAVPVLMLTGLEDLDSIARAYEAGATDFATKPVNWVVLSQRIRYMLRAGRLMDDLAMSEARLAAAQRIALLGNWEFDPREQSWHWSEQIYQLLAYKQSETPDLNLLLKRVHPDDREAVERLIVEVQNREGVHRAAFRLQLPDGTERHIQCQCETEFDENRRPIHTAGVLQDVTEQKRTQEQVVFLENFDRLTELPNRNQFNDRLRYALTLARRHDTCLAVLVLGLDRFKRINDTLGHHVGDHVLRAVSQRILTGLRETDVMAANGAGSQLLARISGDVFTLMLPDMGSVENISKVARRLLNAIAMPVEIDGQEIVITASLGISVFPEDGGDNDQLVRNAEAAMYHAKQAGGDGYHFYDRSMNVAALERLSLETALRRALERGELVLYYQPQIDMHSGAVVGAEALIRWRHPERGLVPPDRFIPLAEETGLIVPIGEWVLHEACRQARRWREQGIAPLRMAVNVSARQFRQSDLADTVTRVLNHTGLDARFLELEITETAVMENAAEASSLLAALNSRGLHIAVDDFGTGYSSLAYLKRFPIDTLKIDRSFVRDITDDPDDAAITSAIVAIARSLGLQTVAEGVETERQLALLRQYGSHLAQGYLFSKPLPAGELEAWLLQRNAVVRSSAG